MSHGEIGVWTLVKDELSLALLNHRAKTHHSLSHKRFVKSNKAKLIYCHAQLPNYPQEVKLISIYQRTEIHIFEVFSQQFDCYAFDVGL